MEQNYAGALKKVREEQSRIRKYLKLDSPDAYIVEHNYKKHLRKSLRLLGIKNARSIISLDSLEAMLIRKLELEIIEQAVKNA